MTDTPTQLRAPSAAYINGLFATYWLALEGLAGLLAAGELIVAEERVTALRGVIVGMMLAANGIERPVFAPNINEYLGESQRIALEKTLVTSDTPHESIVGRVVAFTIIYQWYAPQLVERYGVSEPSEEVQRAYALLAQSVPEWPLTIETA